MKEQMTINVSWVCQWRIAFFVGTLKYRSDFGGEGRGRAPQLEGSHE